MVHGYDNSKLLVEMRLSVLPWSTIDIIVAYVVKTDQVNRRGFPCTRWCVYTLDDTWRCVFVNRSVSRKGNPKQSITFAYKSSVQRIIHWYGFTRDTTDSAGLWVYTQQTCGYSDDCMGNFKDKFYTARCTIFVRRFTLHPSLPRPMIIDDYTQTKLDTCI